MCVRWEVRPWGQCDDGRPEGVLIFTEDITDRKLREIERLEAERKLGLAVITAQEETSRRIAVADLRRALGLPQFPDSTLGGRIALCLFREFAASPRISKSLRN